MTFTSAVSREEAQEEDQAHGAAPMIVACQRFAHRQHAALPLRMPTLAKQLSLGSGDGQCGRAHGLNNTVIGVEKLGILLAIDLHVPSAGKDSAQFPMKAIRHAGGHPQHVYSASVW